MMFKIENLMFKEDFDVNLYCSIKFSFGIKIEEKSIGTCDVCIDNFLNFIEIIDEHGNNFTFKPDGKSSAACINDSTTSNFLPKDNCLDFIGHSIVKESNCSCINHNNGKPCVDFESTNHFCEEDESSHNLVKESANIEDGGKDAANIVDENTDILVNEVSSEEFSRLNNNEQTDLTESKVEKNVDLLKVCDDMNSESQPAFSTGNIVISDHTNVKVEDNILDLSADNNSESFNIFFVEEQADVKVEENADHFNVQNENREVTAFIDSRSIGNINTDLKCTINVEKLLVQQSNKSLSKFKCEKCAKSFSSRGTLKRHISCMHKGAKLFECQKCERYFMTKVDLIIHNSSVHEKVEFKCNECGKIFSRKHHLQRHQEIHLGIKSFQCPECGKSFMLKHHLTQHQMIHSAVKPHKCIVCDKGFILKSSLWRHEQVHVGNKPYKCKECDKFFSQKSYLLAHQNIHKDIKPFQCDQCEKCFSRKTYLARHKKIHKGIKAYQCDVCGKSFIQGGNLKVHKTSHENKVKFIDN